MKNAFYETKRVRVANAAAAAQTQITGSALDMSGYDGVLFVALLNTVTAGCVLTLSAQDCATSGGSYAAITGSATITDSGGATSNQLLVLDVVKPQQRFIEAVLTRTTANAAVDGIVAILYKERKAPTTLDASEAAGAFVNAAS